MSSSNYLSTEDESSNQASQDDILRFEDEEINDEFSENLENLSISSPVEDVKTEDLGFLCPDENGYFSLNEDSFKQGNIYQEFIELQ